MICESCGEYEANVHLKHVTDDVSNEVHLCESCAAKNGINIENPMSLTDIIAGLSGLDGVEEDGEIKTCPLCGMKLTDFRKFSQMGCPMCYETFTPELNQALPTTHKGSQHVGKVPTRAVGDEATDPKLMVLRRELDAAIADEQFERAAELRDEILLQKKAGTSEKEAEGQGADV